MVVALGSCKNKAVPTDTTASVNTKEIASASKIETATFNVSGMSCAVMCANKIEKELASLKGVSKATVDFDKKLATVQYDNAQLSAEKLIETVEAVAGGKLYKVSNLKSTANKAALFQDKEKTRKERRAESRAKKQVDKAAATSTVSVPASMKSCPSSKKCCAGDAKATTL